MAKRRVEHVKRLPIMPKTKEKPYRGPKFWKRFRLRNALRKGVGERAKVLKELKKQGESLKNFSEWHKCSVEELKKLEYMPRDLWDNIRLDPHGRKLREFLDAWSVDDLLSSGFTSRTVIMLMKDLRKSDREIVEKWAESRYEEIEELKVLRKTEHEKKKPKITKVWKQGNPDSEIVKELMKIKTTYRGKKVTLR